MMHSPPSKTTASSSSSTSNASSSFSPYRRGRNGLSPRQRRLLQASRAKAAAPRNDGNNAAHGTNNSAVVTTEAGSSSSPSSSTLAASPSSPSATATVYSPASLSAELPLSSAITPTELKVPLSPITHHHCSAKNSSPPSKPSLFHGGATISASTDSGGSGASTAVLTEATAASIENDIRPRLELNSTLEGGAMSPSDAITDDRDNNVGGISLEEGGVVAKAMRGKVSHRIRTFNNQGSVLDQKDSLSQNGVFELRNQSGSKGSKLMCQEQSSVAQNSSTVGSSAAAVAMQKSNNGMTQQLVNSSSAYSGSRSVGESIQEEVNAPNNNRPLHEKILEEERNIACQNEVEIQRANSPVQGITRTSTGPLLHQQKDTEDRIMTHLNRVKIQDANFPYGKRKQSKSQSSTQQQSFPSDDIDGYGDLRYYRITFKGVVSLLSELDADAGATSQSELQQQHDATTINTNEQGDSNSGTHYYVGYGEIVATYSPEIIIPMMHSEKNRRMAAGNVSETRFMRAIRVDCILTGGYAADASSLDTMAHHGIAKSMDVHNDDWSNLTMNESSADHTMEHQESHYGYLLLSNHHYSNSNQTIAEPIPTAISESLRSSTETGSFLYRITASSPVSVLSGPSMDAIGLGLGLLPGTVHEVSLRISIPLQQMDDVVDDANDTLVDDADAGETQFLRLGQRRGWFADRRIDAVEQKLHVSYLAQDVTNNDHAGCRGLLNNHTLIGGPSSSLPAFDTLIDDTSLPTSFEGDSSSLNSSALNSTANSSFYSSIVASSVPTPTNVKAQRRRNRRRPRATGGGMERSHQQPMTLPSLVRENPCGLGGSFEEAGSSITGGGTDVVTCDGRDSSSLAAAQIQPTKSYYLMRVTAPLGLKILDAPHFQVSNLIHSPSPKKNPRSSPTTSPFARTNAMIGSISADSSPVFVGTRKRNPPRVRFMPRGQIFEASQRMEITGDSSLYTNGQGLIKLADGSGWAIVPHEEDLNEIAAFEEIGNCSIDIPSKHVHHRLTPTKQNQEKASERSMKSIVWLRIAAPPNGIKVLLPPPQQRPISPQHTNKNNSHITPPKHGDDQAKMSLSTSQDSEVASSVVSSSFFDSVWSKVTPSKEKERDHSSLHGQHNIAAMNSLKQQQQQQPMLPVIPCGTVVPVERWDPSTNSEKSFARLFNGQGWIPRCLGDVLYAYEVDTPDIRVGSFWFRVKSTSGLYVRHGQSLNAPIIKSGNNSSFRFECGEFLRASEVVTVFNKTNRATTAECFAKLYRRSSLPKAERNYSSEIDGGQTFLGRYSSLQSLISPGEWVQVHGNGELFLEECSTAPHIERNRENGFRYTTILAGSKIHCGPSLQAKTVGELMCEGEELLVSEKVTAHGEQSAWLRLKSGGWVRSIGNDGQVVMQAISVPSHGNNGSNDNAEHRMVRQNLQKGSHVVY